MATQDEALAGAASAVQSLWDWVKKRRDAAREEDKSRKPDEPPPALALPTEDDEDDRQLWGLALSGGGIRSATFGLGLASGLAQKGIFSRFDLLSTVSGGGYAGSALGKLFTERAQAQPRRMESRLAAMGNSWFVWWLRATSRYLTPRGVKDITSAAALYIRNLFAIHLELALAGAAFGALLALFDLGTWRLLIETFRNQSFLIVPAGTVLQPWMSTLWLPIVLPLALAVSLCSAYWTIPSRPDAKRGLFEGVMAAGMALAGALGIAAVMYWPDGWTTGHDTALRMMCTAVSVMLVLASFGPLFALLARRRGEFKAGADGRAAQRNRLTRWLSWCLAAIVSLVVLGVIDRAAWFVAFELERFKYALPVIVAVGLAVFRTLAEQLQARNQAVAVSGQLGFRIAEWCGALLFALLVVFWVSLVYRGTLANVFGPPPLGELDFGTPAVEAAMFLCLPLAYMLLTGSNADFPNLSSLHMFYRARLMRSFLGATNPKRFPQVPQADGTFVAADPLDAPTPDGLAAAGAGKSVFRVEAGDGIALENYRPHEKGGPVHILNATVNQTFDALGGLFNQDRKGQYLSITSGGQYRIGQQAWQAPVESLAGADLPTWIAISGAAFSPGLGGQTSAGLGALLFMAGVRLGFWWDMGPDKNRAAPPAFWAKYSLLWGEARASFGGVGDRYWYLTDGGHFENTAAYALLRERASMIVVSDAAADPDYQFEDLENLVRKARIDLGAEIRFIDFAGVNDTRFAKFGSIEQLRDPASDACIALARVDYEGGKRGWLVYVKPNMFSGVPIDVANYRCDNPAFPQEPTTDQFFSESQWESYFKLGREIGLQLEGTVLQEIAAGHALADAPVATVTACGATTADAAGKGPLSSRVSLRTLNLAKSGLSLTAVIALFTAGFQTWESLARDTAKKQHDYAEAVATARQAPASEVAGALMKIATEFCQGGTSEVKRQRDVGLLLGAARNDCEKNPARSVTTCQYIAANEVSKCLTGRNPDDPNDSAGTPTYWAIDYRDAALARERVQHALRVEPPMANAAAATASTPAPTASAASGAASAATPMLSDCKGKTIYIQIYDPDQAAEAKSWTDKLRAAGARVPDTDDVTQRAARRGKAAPTQVSAPTAIYHTEEEHACASAMMDAEPKLVPRPAPAGDARPLGGGQLPTPGVIELWLPSEKKKASGS
jgi:hypothetical protein